MSTPAGLYAVLAYDASDFIDLIIESETDALLDLSLMLRLPNPKHTADTRELNAIGAGLVKGVLAKRGVAEPSLVDAFAEERSAEKAAAEEWARYCFSLDEACLVLADRFDETVGPEEKYPTDPPSPESQAYRRAARLLRESVQKSRSRE